MGLPEAAALPSVFVGNEDVLAVLAEAVNAVGEALSRVQDWASVTGRVGQYAIDVVADAAAVPVLLDAGFGVVSEESGVHHSDRGVIVVVDPVDGSTNASRSVPWFATSLCALVEGTPEVALVVNQATGERFQAIKGQGAKRNGQPIRPSGCSRLSEAIVGLSGHAPRHMGWSQYRALGAGALDLCAVACGRLDAYLDTTSGEHGPWDYLGGLLICQEAGALVVDSGGREMVVLDHDSRRAPVAAATQDLLRELMAAIAPAAGE